jgi:hypothetical protein
MASLTLLQEGAFAFVFKSIHFPDELVVCRRGSPVLIGVKTDKKLKVDFVDVEFGGSGDDKMDSRACRTSSLCEMLVLTVSQIQSLRPPTILPLQPSLFPLPSLDQSLFAPSPVLSSQTMACPSLSSSSSLPMLRPS